MTFNRLKRVVRNLSRDSLVRVPVRSSDFFLFSCLSVKSLSRNSFSYFVLFGYDMFSRVKSALGGLIFEI